MTDAEVRDELVANLKQLVEKIEGGEVITSFSFNHHIEVRRVPTMNTTRGVGDKNGMGLLPGPRSVKIDIQFGE